MTSTVKFKIADLVKTSSRHQWVKYEGHDIGIVIDTDINAWSEEVVPSGVEVLWSSGESEIVYEDEIESVQVLNHWRSLESVEGSS